jgi:hypothetical protein
VIGKKFFRAVELNHEFGTVPSSFVVYKFKEDLRKIPFSFTPKRIAGSLRVILGIEII